MANKTRNLIVILLIGLVCALMVGCKDETIPLNKILLKSDKEKIDWKSIDPKMISYVELEYFDEGDNRHSYEINFKDSEIIKDEISVSMEEKDMDELAKYILNYNPTVFSGQYWPQTDEYPEMKVLFKYKIAVCNSLDDLDDCTEYKIDGCSDYGYPEHWDDFIQYIDQSM